MLNTFISWVKGVIFKLVHIAAAKSALKVDVAISSDMQTAIDLWTDMFRDNASWLDTNTQSLGLPAAIAGEIARLATTEMESTIEGSPRADFLNAEYQQVLDSMRVNVEIAAACGGVAFKPYLDDGHIAIDVVPAWRFLPTAFNSRGEVTGAVFVEQVTKGKTYYTRMEAHRLTNAGYTIQNLAYSSQTESSIGTPVELTAVDEWAMLEPETTISYKGGKTLEGVLFAYFKMPFANNIDTNSPIGVSVYSRATGLIEQADKQYSRILWEYEGSELAIDASDGALQVSNLDGELTKVPARRKRLFRELGLDQGTSGDLYKVFSPTIRDTSLFNGLDKILKRIEFNCYLSYGTLSDPQQVEKTAEEIKTSKQRSFSAVSGIQTSLKTALEHLVWVMDVYATMYKLAPRGAYELSVTWGDGIMENADVEFARRKMLVDSGLLKPEKLLAWYFGISEEEALTEYLPASPEPIV